MGTPAAPDWDSLIPIDPALQSQSQLNLTLQSRATPYTPYTGYTQHYQQQQAAYQAYQPQQQQYAPAPTPARQSTQDSSNVATLNDAVGSAGVDLQAEEEKLRASTTQSTASSSSRPKLDRSRTQPLNPNFDLELLKPRLAEIAAHHKLTGGVPEEIAVYVALALRTRLENLVVQMSVAARHRTDTQFDRPALYGEGLPMWSLVVRSDVAKQAAVLERIEREEETKVRRERKERADMTAAHTAALAAQAAGGGGASMDYDDDGEGGKRKKKKDGPGVTARNMSEDVRKKMSNAVASQAAGIGGKYSWMTAGNAAAAAAKPVKAASATPATSTPAGTTATTTTGGTGWARAYVPKKTGAAEAPAPTPVEEDTRTAITIRDAQFVVEKERGHGGGRGSGKGWT
ncbi:transcription initiation factor TFIID component TAF4 family-domain-containing protein [Mycena rosella]|uniref:Transcription initiation factor TFIID subunit 4 n=1 Tax=Mycena rosella TaxID=1033263 RepID=A0AAD7DBI4_MYCRO|nr:transcription initiation factor TFIID component TAF4 family-domain-containing protein [Mycena rosella]